ncbi:MAG: protein kinase [Dehalococcoidia bacterium]|nr:protein kinase [Dehalococcoidia bacterium]
MDDRSSIPAGIPEVLKHYRLVRRLGAGGMGSVFEAVDRRDDSRVAVKLLHPHLAGDANFRERFEREAHVAALLRSPYTVHLLDFGYENGCYFLVMEFIDGQSVADALAGGPMDPRQALHIAADAARALQESAARGIVHRDIKPENVLLGPHDSVKVADFGIAREAGGGSLTMPGGFVGTTAYAAPEQASGEVDTRADIYALGGTLYCMLAGHPPFSGSAFDVMRAHREASIPMGPIAHLPDAVINVIRRAMEKDPADRYQSPSELIGALDRAGRALTASFTTSSGQPTQPTVMQPAPKAFATPLPPSGSDLAATTPPPPPAAPVDVAPAPEQAALGAAGIARGEPITSAPNARQAVAAGIAVAPPATPRLELGPAKGGGLFGKTGPKTFAVRVHNPGAADAEYTLAAASDDGVRLHLPASVRVPAGGSSVVRLKAAAPKRRWKGATERRAFTVTAAGGGGVPPMTITGSMDDEPLGWLPYGGGLVFCAGIAGVVGAMLLLGGGGGGSGDDDPALSSDDRRATREARADATATIEAQQSRTPRADATPSPARTAPPVPSVESTPTSEVTTVATITATTAPATLVPTRPAATPVPTQAGAPPQSIQAGQWEYYFYVTDTTCTSGPAVGDVFPMSLSITEYVPDDGFISVGESVLVTDSISGQAVGIYEFTWPVFAFEGPLLDTNGWKVYFENSYTGPNSGSGYREDHYFDGCVITYQE